METCVVKHRFTGEPLFTHSCENNSLRTTLETAIAADANLSGAKIKDNSILVGQRPIFQVGPIGSRCAYFTAYITSNGLRFDAGCQRQITREEFEKRLQASHGGTIHEKEYRAALQLIDIHAELWTPKEVA